MDWSGSGQTYHPDVQERLQSNLDLSLEVDEDDEGSDENEIRASSDLSINKLYPVIRLVGAQKGAASYREENRRGDEQLVGRPRSGPARPD